MTVCGMSTAQQYTKQTSWHSERVAAFEEKIFANRFTATTLCTEPLEAVPDGCCSRESHSFHADSALPAVHHEAPPSQPMQSQQIAKFSSLMNLPPAILALLEARKTPPYTPTRLLRSDVPFSEWVSAKKEYGLSGKTIKSEEEKNTYIVKEPMCERPRSSRRRGWSYSTPANLGKGKWWA